MFPQAVKILLLNNKLNRNVFHEKQNISNISNQNPKKLTLTAHESWLMAGLKSLNPKVVLPPSFFEEGAISTYGLKDRTLFNLFKYDIFSDKILLCRRRA